MQDADIFTALATASRITVSLRREETVVFTVEGSPSRFNDKGYYFSLRGLVDKQGVMMAIVADFCARNSVQVGPRDRSFFIAGDKNFAAQKHPGAKIEFGELGIALDGHKFPSHADDADQSITYSILHYLELMNSISARPHIVVVGTKDQMLSYGLPAHLLNKHGQRDGVDLFNITLNLSYGSLKNGFYCTDSSISFECRFGGKSYPIEIPYSNIMTMYSNGYFGMTFESISLKDILGIPLKSMVGDDISLDTLVPEDTASDEPVSFDTLLDSE